MEQSVEEKLKALFELQTLHTQIDKIRQTRGELPMEVADLEDEVAGLETRIQKIKAELDELEDSIVTRKNMIKEALAATKKYETQLNDVKNNREYDAISKEVEIQGLEIQVSEKKIRHILRPSHNIITTGAECVYSNNTLIIRQSMTLSCAKYHNQIFQKTLMMN